MAERLVVKSGVEKVVGKDTRISKEFWDALDNAVRDMIKNAEKRAKNNKRKTLRPYDL